jgi:hypothetical protein
MANAVQNRTAIFAGENQRLSLAKVVAAKPETKASAKANLLVNRSKPILEISYENHEY